MINIRNKNIFFQECSFVRCIKPNAKQCSEIFDENMVQTQLISSGSIAYQQLMRIGFPSHISIVTLFNMFKSKSEFTEYTHKNPKEFCNMLIRSCGLMWKDFKLGNTQIFFRSEKLEILSEKLKEDAEVIKYRLEKCKLLRKKFRAAIIFARSCAIFHAKFSAISQRHRKRPTDLPNEVQMNEPKKKKLTRKPNKYHTQPNPITMQSELETEGNSRHILNWGLRKMSNFHIGDGYI